MRRAAWSSHWWLYKKSSKPLWKLWRLPKEEACNPRSGMVAVYWSFPRTTLKPPLASQQGASHLPILQITPKQVVGEADLKRVNSLTLLASLLGDHTMKVCLWAKSHCRNRTSRHSSMVHNFRIS